MEIFLKSLEILEKFITLPLQHSWGRLFSVFAGITILKALFYGNIESMHTILTILWGICLFYITVKGFYELWEIGRKRLEWRAERRIQERLLKEEQQKLEAQRREIEHNLLIDLFALPFKEAALLRYIFERTKLVEQQRKILPPYTSVEFPTAVPSDNYEVRCLHKRGWLSRRDWSSRTDCMAYVIPPEKFSSIKSVNEELNKYSWGYPMENLDKYQRVFKILEKSQTLAQSISKLLLELEKDKTAACS